MFQKVRFTDSRGNATAGLVIESGTMTVSELSTMFPPFEWQKMEKIQVSDDFRTWKEAFEYTFPELKKG